MQPADMTQSMFAVVAVKRRAVSVRVGFLAGEAVDYNLGCSG